MAKKRYKNIIFDLDGTLVDTAPDIINCLKQAFAEVLKQNDIKISEKIIGPPVSEMIKKTKPDLNDQEVEALTNEFRVCYDNSVFPDTYLYEGVRKLLNVLQDEGCRIFLVTNKPMLPTRKIIKKLKIDLFDKVVTSDILPKKKLSKSEMIEFLVDNCCLNPAKSIIVGDTQEDVFAARENSIASVVLLSGYGNNADLVRAKPKYILGNIEDLIKCL